MSNVADIQKILTDLQEAIQEKLKENHDLIKQFMDYFQVEENRIIVATLESVTNKLKPYYSHLEGLEKKAVEFQVDVNNCVKTGNSKYNQIKDSIMDSVRVKIHEGVTNVGCIVDKYQANSTEGLQTLLKDIEEVEKKLTALDADYIEKTMPEINKKISEIPNQMDSNFKNMVVKIQEIGENIAEYLDARFQNIEIVVGIIQAEAQLCVYSSINDKINSVNTGATKKRL